MPVVSSIITAAVISTGALAAGATATAVGVVGATAVYGGLLTSAIMSKQSSNDERKAQANMAADAASRAANIEKEAKAAEIQSQEQAKIDAQKRLRAQTQTIFTSPLGIVDNANTSISKTTLGAN